MRICMFFSIFPPRYGGGTKQALKLARALRDKGVDIFFVALSDHPEQKCRGVFEGFDVYFIPLNNLDIFIEGRSPLHSKILLIVKLFAKFFTLRNKYSIIHLQGLAYPYTTLSMLAKALNKKIMAKISMLQETNFGDCGRTFGRISRYSALRIDKLISISSMIRDKLIDDDFERSRVLFIPNSVDIRNYRPLQPDEKFELKREMNIDSGTIITFVGGITYRKGADRLISIWHPIYERYPDSQLILIGPRSGEEGASGDRFCYDEVKREIGEYRMVDRVSFTGRIDNVEKYLQISDLFVFPSRMEGMPNVILEAMACGVPAVSYRVSGVDDIISDGENGYIVDIGDESGFSEAVTDLLDNERKRENFSRRAREEIVNRFSLDFVSDQYILVYRSLLES